MAPSRAMKQKNDVGEASPAIEAFGEEAEIDDSDGDINVMEDEDGLCNFLSMSLGSTARMRVGLVDFLGSLFPGLEKKEGGGLRGGRVPSEMMFLGVPGSDSHRKGTAPAATP